MGQLFLLVPKRLPIPLPWFVTEEKQEQLGFQTDLCSIPDVLFPVSMTAPCWPAVSSSPDFL
jgi:hypothetical protein